MIFSILFILYQSGFGLNPRIGSTTLVLIFKNFLRSRPISQNNLDISLSVPSLCTTSRRMAGRATTVSPVSSVNSHPQNQKNQVHQHFFLMVSYCSSIASAWPSNSSLFSSFHPVLSSQERTFWKFSSFNFLSHYLLA